MTSPLVLQANDPSVSSIVFRGKTLQGDLTSSIISAGFTSSIDEITDLTIGVSDEGLKLAASKLFTKGSTANFRTYGFEVTAIDIEEGQQGTGQMNVSFRSAVIGNLKRRVGSLVMRNVSRSDFVIRESLAAGARVIAQPSGRSATVSRDVLAANQVNQPGIEPPSSWTTFQRLANDINFLCFESAGTVYFGKLSYFVTLSTLPVAHVFWNIGDEYFRTLSVPNCHDSLDSTVGRFINFNVPLSRFNEFQTGWRLVVHNVPMFDGIYIITRVQCSLLGDGSMYIEAVSPPGNFPIPTMPVKTTAISARSANVSVTALPDVGGETKSASDFVSFALTQAGSKTIMGVTTQPSTPGTFDCSELIVWAAEKVGVFVPHGTDNQIAYFVNNQIDVEMAFSVRGAIFLGANGIAISLGNGKLIESVNGEVGVNVSPLVDDYVTAYKIPNLVYMSTRG